MQASYVSPSKPHPKFGPCKGACHIPWEYSKHQGMWDEDLI